MKAEKPGAPPRYRPGDIVTCKDGGVGIIIEAQTTIYGQTFDWNEKIVHPGYECGSPWPPQYGLQQVPGRKALDYHAWWEASEWRSVKLGLLHAKPRALKS